MTYNDPIALDGTLEFTDDFQGDDDTYEADPYDGHSSFCDYLDANAVYAGVTERAFNAARVAEDRSLNNAYRADDNARRRNAHRAERAANPDAVREATRKRVAAYRARKRAERAAKRG